MTLKEFIENYVKGPKGESIKLTPIQCAFLNWLEECKKKQLKPLNWKVYFNYNMPTKKDKRRKKRLDSLHKEQKARLPQEVCKTCKEKSSFCNLLNYNLCKCKFD